MNKLFCIVLVCFLAFTNNTFCNEISASQILGNPKYQAICYGGYRTCTRNVVPTVAQIKDDLKILSAMNIKVLRTYNVHFSEIDSLLIAITQLQQKSNFEMYVMLGAWIDCKNAWTTETPIHNEESQRNTIEINRAVALANQYPNIIKIISVGNEAMVKWATSYYVTPNIILKWVNHLQDLKKQNKLSKNIWITSSDNYASWGGADSSYHNNDLKQLIKAVDYISLHTYPMHDTHYNPTFWGVKKNETSLKKTQQIEAVMQRAKGYAMNQYNSVVQYVKKLGVKKQIHIGETGWASQCNELYGNKGSKAVDEYKAGVYYKMMRDWTTKQKISCFFFEAFDECWKNGNNPLHSENHFGLINANGEAKYALWSLVDKNVFNNLKRNGKSITKSFDGNVDKLLQEVELPNKIINN